VLACDPPVDWSRIHSADDFLPYMERDTTIASVIEREVLSKHRRALLLFGLGHVTHGGGAVGRYEQRYPNATFVIADHRGFAKDNDTLERRMAAWPLPALAPVRGSWLDRLDDSYFDGFPGPWGSAFVDAYLYVGPRAGLLHQPISARTVLDASYLAELERRSRAVDPAPAGLPEPAATLRSESESSVFFSVAP
jgi:hypothetical protein